MALAANANSPLQKLRAALKSCLFGQGRLVYLTGLELDWSWSVGPQWEPLPFPLTSALVQVLGGRRALHTAAATLGLSIFISAQKFTHLLSLEVKVGEAVVHPDRQLHTSPRRRNAGKWVVFHMVPAEEQKGSQESTLSRFWHIHFSCLLIWD